LTTTATPGVVDFFIRPDSFNSSEEFRDIINLDAPGISVSGQSGFGILYEQRFIVPEEWLSGDWWTSNIQRESAESTYTDDVILTSVALEYRAGQSCVEQFGSAPGFILCEETPATCRFNANANGGTCDEICGLFGSTCVGAQDNETAGCVSAPNNTDTCQTPRESEICICAR
jgi:hypothetical protein